MNKNSNLFGIANSLGLLVVFSYLVFQYTHQQKLAYIDIAVLMNEYQGMIDARMEYQKKANEWQANADTLAAEFEVIVNQYESAKNNLSTTESAKQLQLIKTKRDQLLKYQETVKNKSALQDRQMTDQVRMEINKFLKDFGKNNNYKIIFGATELGNILYTKEGIDITSEVIEGLNNGYGKK